MTNMCGSHISQGEQKKRMTHWTLKEESRGKEKRGERRGGEERRERGEEGSRRS
jgi:hypothetical protein